MQARSEPRRLPEPAAADRALARAVLCHFFKQSLRRPADGSGGELASPAAREALAQAGGLLQGSVEGALSGGLRDLCRGFDQGATPRGREHARLFGHTLRGEVCPNETEYGQPAMLQQAQELADLSGFYHAFGLRPAPAERERADHVACELEFAEFLSRKEAYALGIGDLEMAEVTRGALSSFLERHLGRFGRAFAASLRAADEGGFYGGVGRLLEAFLSVECDHLGVQLGPQVLELRPAEPDGVPMACGPGDQLVQIGAHDDGPNP